MNATGPTNLARLADRLGAPDAAASGRDVERVMAGLGRRARAASHRLALAAEGEKNAALRGMATAIRAAAPAVLAANADDVAEAKSRGQAGSFLDRLMLD
ncbi:MAG TPA: gamma-glutamyl-phosphate reductase, partial [Beijerinckiaceae bacterium]|nr:gamma-glutamyl-phosphate reductase [Beijerinckiaceae bacterium]